MAAVIREILGMITKRMITEKHDCDDREMVGMKTKQWIIGK